jgi:hypothetical protein
MSEGRRAASRVGARPIAVAALSCFLAASLATSSPAWAAEPAPAATTEAPEPVVDPPPRGKPYVQFGVAFTVEGVVSPGPICAVAADPCIFGSGGGISARVGWRPTENVYIGGAYEFSKQDPSRLYRLGILQQARAELRRYIPTDHSIAPFVLAGLGIAGYGDEWAVDTWGPTATLGGGVEIELAGRSLIGLSLAYRPIYLHAFEDSSTLSHNAGIAHLLGLELALEAQDVL